MLDDIFKLSRNVLKTFNTPSRRYFYIDNTYTFEIGGRKKNFKQIKDIQNPFLQLTT